MKVLGLLLLAVPLAMAAPDRRSNPFLDAVLNVFHTDEIKTIVTDLYHSMGTDEREAECESECIKLVDTQFSTGSLNTIGHTSCPLICHSYQELVHHYDIAPSTAATSAPSRRALSLNPLLTSILNVFHADEVKTIVTDLYHSMGTDEREGECEKECNTLMDNQFQTGAFNTIGHTSCPLICHSFQELVKQFDITPQTAVPAAGTSAKRSFGSSILNSILNVFHADEIKTIVTDLYHSMGTDEREAECESECIKLVDTQFATGSLNTIGHTSCPLICHSYQELVHHYDLTPSTAVTSPPAKRAFSLNPLLTSILNVFHADEVKTIVTDLYHSMGTDEREGECEKECSNLIETQFHAGTINTLGHTACPLICHSFQELVKHYDITPQTAVPASGTSAAKRSMTSNLILNSILHIFHADEIKTIVTDLYHSMGSDEREGECEKECSNLIETQFHAGTINTLGHTACPLICHSFQELVGHFDITPQTAVPAAGTSAAKRSMTSNLILNSILHIFHADEIKTIVTDLYHSMGSDEREGECEKECSNLIETQFHAGTINTLGHTACPLICHSFQELVKHFDLTPQTAVPAAGTSAAKRSMTSNLILNSILHIFHADEIKTIVTDLYHSMGSDEREGECEKECSNLIETQFHAGTINTLGHTACPLICHSFQELVKHFDLTPQTAVPAAGTSAAKRSMTSNLIMNSILHIFHADEIKTIVTDLYHSMGSDEREGECEKECNSLVDTQFSTGTTNTLGHTACPLVCHSFQELVGHFDLSPTTAPAPGMTPV